MKINFADFIRNKRIEAGYTLREFCKATGFDPSNWSKTERGLLKPPQSKAVLEEIARVLNLGPGTEPYKELFDLAAISSIPDELVEKEILNQLPVFFRTVRLEKPTEKELENLIQKIRSAWQPEK